MCINRSETNLAIEDLLSPRVFPHSVSELELLETHISWVILTGKFAYKIKKPVRFEFVDYSTLELRKKFCLRELELNRRFAPDLYIDVVGITETESGFQFGTDSSDHQFDNGVEFAVKMKQFPQEAILAAKLNHSELNADSITQFAKYLAEFHECIESAVPTLDCVQASRIVEEARDNFSELRDGFENDDARVKLVDRLDQWTVSQSEELQEIFSTRLNDGMVRRCHGDLHLKNIIQLDERLIAFDGVEFNEKFQWIDLLSEVAFPVMDFIARGQPSHGWRLLDSYLEATGDYEGLPLLRFYLTYRAMVRAKVTWLNPNNHQADRREKFQANASSVDALAGPWDKYLGAAEFFAFEMRPSLSITHGFSGSGKSTRSWQLMENGKGVRIRSDVKRHQLTRKFKVANPYSLEVDDWVYGYLLELARNTLQSGMPVVVDATFLKQTHRLAFRNLAEELNVDFQIIDCDAPFDELCQRIEKRTDDPSEADLNVLKMQMKTHDPLTTLELQFVYNHAE